MADARLPEDVARLIRGATLEPEPGREPRHTLLTGATGFLGAFLLRDLLTRTTQVVTCLVRAKTAAEGTARVQRALEKYDLWRPDFAGRIRVMPGKLEAARLGLAPGAYDALADDIDLILHNAAQVSYVQPYATHKAANVDGALEILRLASHRKSVPIHYVSTIAVFGPAARFAGRTRLAGSEELDAHVEGLRFDIGYSQSKWVAEKLFTEAKTLGARISIYRPGFIMGDSGSGAGNVDDFMARLVKGCVQIGAYPDLPGQRKEFVPVDYVSHAIVTIAAQTSRLGGSYHLVPPRAEQSPLLNDFFEMVRDGGYPLERLSYDRWIDKLISHPDVEDNALYPLTPMLSEKVYLGETTRWELYEHMPVYDASATVEALGQSIERFQPMDRDLLAKYLAHFVGEGFLAPPSSQGSRAA